MNEVIDIFVDWLGSYTKNIVDKVYYEPVDFDFDYDSQHVGIYIDNGSNIIFVDTFGYDSRNEKCDDILLKLVDLGINKKVIATNIKFNKDNFYLLHEFPSLVSIYLSSVSKPIDLSFIPKNGMIHIVSGEFNKEFDLSLLTLPSRFQELAINTRFKNLNKINKHTIKKLYISNFEKENEFQEIKKRYKYIESLTLLTTPFRHEEFHIDFSSFPRLEKLLFLDISGVGGNNYKFPIRIKNKKLKELMAVGLNIDIDVYNSESLIDISAQNCIFNNNFFEESFKSKTLNILNLLRVPIKIGNLGVENNSLEILSLVDCHIDDMDFIYKFKNIKKINLSHNKIEKIPNLLPDSLVEINLSNCEVVNIQKSFIKRFKIKHENEKIDFFDTQFEFEKELNIYGNPIENPPIEIINQGNDALLEYSDSMEGETTTLNEAKIIFVGDGAVGKTSLMKRLVNNSFCEQEEQTDGIEIESIKIDTEEGETINASIWDFGGQQILQATHQLFLSKRSVYILVVEDRKNDQHKDQDIEQWLTQINSLGGEPPILIVKNKIDENPHSDIQSNKLKEKFNNIIGFYEVSCKNREGIDKLNRALSEIIINLPMRKIELPKNWLHVKNELKEQAERNDLLYLNTYNEICKKFEINSKLAKDTLLKMLHDLGAVIAFDELASHNTAILNPHWITEGIYALLRSNTLAQNNGIIDRVSAQLALDSYSDHNRFDGKAQYIIDAMKTFDLCHLTNETDQYLIPILLPPQIDLSDFTSTEEQDISSLRFIFKFEKLLPPPLLPMFLVKVHDKIQGNRRWRTGAIVAPSFMDATAIVDADLVSKEIKITISGNDKRDLFVTLRATIKEIISRITDPMKIGLQELIPLSDTKERVSYDELIGLKNMGESTYLCGKLGLSFPISRLLGEIEPPEDTEKALRTLLKSGSKNSLFSIHMNQKQQNTNTATGGNATGGSATNNVTSSQDQVASSTSTATSTSEVKMALRAFKGQSEFVIEDIEEAIDDLTSSDRVLKENAKRECDKVSKAIETLESSVEDNDTADQNLRHFSRVQNFLEGALHKANSVGKVIDSAGNLYTQVESLAVKYNEIASKFAMPLVAIAGLG